MFGLSRKKTNLVTSLMQVTASYRCTAYTEYPHEVVVEMTFFDENLKAYLLDHEYFKCVSVYRAMLSIVTITNFKYVDVNPDTYRYFDIMDLLAEGKQIVSFREKYEAEAFANSIDRKLYKFFYEYVHRFTQISLSTT